MVKYIYCLVLFGAMAGHAFAMEQTDSLADKHLGEVTVMAAREVNQGGGKFKLYMTAADRNFGTNALDAISHMQRFTARLDASDLLTWDGQKVLIVINDVPSDGFDLRSYKADQIRYVEYYSVAPPKYAMLTSGPVVNVVIKRQHDMLLSASFNTSNAVTTGFGTNQLDLTYADSLNSVKVGYIVDYRDVHRLSQQSEYDYGSFMTRYDLTGRYSGVYQRINASYQRFQGNDFFVARFNYVPDYGTEHYTGAGELIKSGLPFSAISDDKWRRSNSKSFSADLYYHHKFSSSRLMAVNVVNSFGRSSSYSSISQRYSGMEGYDQFAVSDLRNKAYTMVAQVSYSSKLWGYNFDVAGRYTYSRLSQDYRQGRSTPFSHDVFAYAAYTLYDNRNTWTIAPLVGMVARNQHTGAATTTSVTPVFTLYAGYYSPSVTGLMATLRGQISSMSITESSLAPSVSVRDPWLVSMGNPSLKRFGYGYARFTLAYYHPRGKWQAQIYTQPELSRRRAVTILGEADGMFFMRKENLEGNVFVNTLEATAKYKVLPWLEVGPYFELYSYRYRMPDCGKVSEDYMRCGGSVTVNSGLWSVVLFANSRTKEYDGHIITGGSAQYGANVLYKYRNCSIGARYNYSGQNEYTSGVSDAMRYVDRTDWAPMKHLVRLTFTYYISKGKARNHDYRRLDNSVTETGLNDNTRVKAPGD